MEFNLQLQTANVFDTLCYRSIVAALLSGKGMMKKDET